MNEEHIYTVQMDSNRITLPNPHPDVCFRNADGVVVRIQFEPELKAILTEGANWDDAAKAFWNAVHLIMGHSAPFPEIL